MLFHNGVCVWGYIQQRVPSMLYPDAVPLVFVGVPNNVCPQRHAPRMCAPNFWVFFAL